MRWLAPAKINLHLRVGKRRAGAFHPLCSWMVTIGLFDKLVLKRDPSKREPSGRETPGGKPSKRDGGGALSPGTSGQPGTSGKPATSGEPDQPGDQGGASGVGVVAAELPFRCDDPTIPTDDTNLAVKAARAFVTAQGLRSLPWSITLLKSIPHGGGLGGGSSDAATTLVALNHLHKAGWAVGRLADVGATVGSDVPFFFSAPSAVITGRGQIVRSTPRPAAKWAVLVLPALAVPTAECYRRFDAMGLGDDAAVENEPDFTGWSKLNAAELSARLVNDLEAAAFALQPMLGELRSRIERDTKHVVRMSGSGSSLFTLADDSAEAMEVVSIVQRIAGVRALAVEVAPGVPQIEHGWS